MIKNYISRLAVGIAMTACSWASAAGPSSTHYALPSSTLKSIFTPSAGLPLAVSSIWVVNPGGPAAKVNLLPNAASANIADPVPSRLLRFSGVMTLLLWLVSLVTGNGDPIKRCKIRAMRGVSIGKGSDQGL